jgi:hypothetical protein
MLRYARVVRYWVVIYRRIELDRAGQSAVKRGFENARAHTLLGGVNVTFSF